MGTKTQENPRCAQDCPRNCSRAEKWNLLSQDPIQRHSREIHHPHSSLVLSTLKNWGWRGG